MTTAADVAAVLRELESGDAVRLATTGLDEPVVGGVVGVDVARAERDSAGIPVPGRITAHLEVTGDEWADSDLPTHSVTVRVDEDRPEEWSDPDASVWDPEVDDEGFVVEDDWRHLGSVTGLQRVGEDQEAI